MGNYIGFWTFNMQSFEGRDDREEIAWQLDEMQKKGIKEFIVHLRFGHKLPYLSMRWKEIVEYILIEAARRSMSLWMWDDDAWPPGFAGGKLTQEHMEYRGRSLSASVIRLNQNGKAHIEISKNFPVAVQAVQSGTGVIIDVTEYVGTYSTEWRRFYHSSLYIAGDKFKDKNPHWRANKTSPSFFLDWEVPEGEWELAVFTIDDGYYKYNGYVTDMLNPDAVSCWISCNHEWYKKHFQAYFGNVFKGFYCAEPPHNTWTPRLFSYFQSMKGYDLKPYMAHLSMDISEDSARIRMDYQQVRAELYSRHFTRMIRKWCDDNRLQFMGRFGYEESSVQMIQYAGDLYPAIRDLSCVTSDLINGLQIGDEEHSILNYGINYVYSIGRQNAVPLVFEGGGPINWKVTLENVRHLCDWGFIMGADRITSENLFYSVDGYRKYDCPPSFFYQNPYWEVFQEFVDRYARMNQWIEGFKERPRRTALLLPVSTCFAHTKLFTQREQHRILNEIEEVLLKYHQALIELHIPFDILSETAMSHAVVEGNRLLVDWGAYETVIIPACTHLRDETCEILDMFADNNGKLLMDLRYPIAKIGKVDQGVSWWKPHRHIAVTDPADTEFKKLMAGSRLIDMPSSAICRSFVRDHEEIVFILNTGAEDLSIPLNSNSDQELHILDLEEAAVGRIEGRRLKSLQLAAITTGKHCIRVGCAEPVNDSGSKRVKLNLDPVWAVEEFRNVLLMKDFHLSVQPLSIHGQCMLSEAAPRGISTVLCNPGPFSAHAAAGAAMPSRLIYKSMFRLDGKIKGDLYLLIESEAIQGEYKIWLNHIEIPDKQFEWSRVYDVGNRLAKITEYVMQGTMNELCIEVIAKRETDGLLHPIRILGGFAIRDRQNSTVLLPPERQLKLGTWTVQGYPHFSGWGALTQQLCIPPDLWAQATRNKQGWFLDFGEIGEVCRLYIDGSYAGSRLWKPYSFDITAILRRPDACIRLEIGNSAGNMIFGEQIPSGLLGPVFLYTQQ